MSGNSRGISTNQQGIHDKLDTLVSRYRTSENRRPVSDHTFAAFEKVSQWLGDWQGGIILDSCCGVGESTANIALRYPECKVIGLDKSALRVDKHSYYLAQANNAAVFRADVIDFWRLVKTANWSVRKHYLLYPNPYPKASHVQKRWHGSPAMVDLMAITTNIEVRSNWLIYLMEFAQAAAQYGLIGDIAEISDPLPITPFERKYRASGQSCWRLVTRSDELD